MTSEYSQIYSIFLGRITDYEFLKLPEKDVYALMNEYLHAVAARPFMRKLFSSFVLDDDVEEISFEMRKSIDEFYDAEFVNQVLARGMVIEWLEPKVKSVLNVNQFYGGKETSFYSQANHLNEIKDLLAQEKIDMRKMIRDYPYSNFILNGL